MSKYKAIFDYGKEIERKNEYKYGCKVPCTDEEVYECIDQSYDRNVGACLKSIYKLNRQGGNDVLEAWRRTLLTHVETFKRRLETASV